MKPDNLKADNVKADSVKADNVKADNASMPETELMAEDSGVAGERHSQEWSIRQAQQQVDAWIQSIGVRYFSELTNLAQLMEEVGEVARILARTHGEQSFKAGENAALADELADVLFVIICLANQSGIDLQTALAENLRKKTTRDKVRHLQNKKLKPPS